MFRQGIIEENFQNSMIKRLGTLGTLFTTEVSGGTAGTTGTPPIQGPQLESTTPLDNALMKVMNAIRNDRGFDALEEKEGDFIENWRELTAVVENWDSLVEKPKDGWLKDLPTLWYLDSRRPVYATQPGHKYEYL